MKTCNTTMTKQGPVPTGAQVFPYLYDCCGTVGSAFLLVVIRKTKTLKGPSGFLLLNEQVCCLLEQALSLAFTYILTNEYVIKSFYTHSIVISGMQTVKNVSLQILFIINGNLFLAICMSQRYRSIVTWKRIVLLVGISWVLSIPVGMGPVFYDYFALDCDSMILLPRPKASTIWRLVVYLLQSAIILSVSSVLLYKICHRRSSVQPDSTLRARSETDKKVKLSKFIFILAIIHTITFTNEHWISHAAAFFPHSFKWEILFFSTVTMNKMYANLRIFFYLPLYRPLWETTKALLCRCKKSRIYPTVILEPRPEGLEPRFNGVNSRPSDNDGNIFALSIPP